MPDETLDGTGGGFGRYRGFDLREIERQFQICKTDPTMRGVSAVLRIAREQLEARGHLGAEPQIFAAFVGLALAPLALIPVFVPAAKETLERTSLAFAVLALIYGAVALSLRKDRKRALYQEQRIREMALATLLEIVTREDFVRKPLDLTQRLTLEKMLKKSRRKDPALLELL